MSLPSLDDFLKELQVEDSTDAPFGLQETEKHNNRIVFEKVRAKNFRSVGSEFMELDFLKHKTTLVVSEDNGSGKSTLSVWAPYFALTGKPYSKKEKIGALVNTQNRKDLLVELYLTTRGISYKIVRGYKPAVFDIYKKEAGSWIKFEAPPSTSQQQANLEELLGFDAKIIEKTMVLGLDKFEPFIDLDAPTRRALIEKIWDLQIFSVMLEEAKKRIAVIKRNMETTSIDIDKHEASIESENEKIKLAKSYEQELEVAKQELEHHQSLVQSIKDEITQAVNDHDIKVDEYRKQVTALKAQAETLEQEIRDKFASEGDEVKANLDKVLAEGEKLESEAAAKFDSELSAINNSISELTATNEAESNQLKVDLAGEMNTIKGEFVNARTTAEQKVAEWLEQQPQEAPELSAAQANLQILTETLNTTKASLEAAQADFEAAVKSGSTLELEESNLKARVKQLGYESTNVQEKLAEFEAAEKKLLETGNCPHCLQEIGEASIKLLRESTADKRNELEAKLSEINKEIEQVLSKVETAAQERAEGVQRRADLSHSNTLLAQQLEKEKDEVRAAEFKIKEINSNFIIQREAAIDKMKAEITEAARQKMADFKNESIARINQLKATQESAMSKLEQERDTLKSKIDTSIAQAKQKASEAASDARTAFNTWQQRLDSEIKATTSETKEKIESFERAITSAKQSHERMMSELNVKQSNNDSAIEKRQASIASLEQRISNSVSESEARIKDISESLEALKAEHQELHDKSVVMAYIIGELGDNAAKSEIIKQYIPFLNAKINEYMAAMNLFVGFKMDEKFEVQFTSPDRKNQTVHSLSNGQKTRMNLAILFAMRDIANLKNTADTNLLILDELLESMSEQGVREVVEMLRCKFSNSNIVVITQRKTEFCEYFDNVINYGLRGGFTTIVEE